MRRVQFRLKDKAEELFDRIVEKTGEDDRDVFMDALALYDVALEEISKGRSFGSYDPEEKSFEGIWTPMLRTWQSKQASEREKSEKTKEIAV